MTESERITLITFVVGPTVLAVVNWLLNRPQRHALRRIEGQVSNDHVDDPTKTSNLREDLDEKIGAVLEKIADIGSTIARALRDIGGIREDIRQLRKDLSHTNGRVDDLERTHPKGLDHE